MEVVIIVIQALVRENKITSSPQLVHQTHHNMALFNSNHRDDISAQLQPKFERFHKLALPIKLTIQLNECFLRIE